MSAGISSIPPVTLKRIEVPDDGWMYVYNFVSLFSNFMKVILNLNFKKYLVIVYAI